MCEQARFFLSIFVSSCILIPMTASKINSTDDTIVMSQLGGDNVPRNHIDICCSQFEGYMNWERNDTGHTVSKSGFMIDMMDWLSISMKFEYECIPLKESDRFMIDSETNTSVLTSQYLLKEGICNLSPWPWQVISVRFKDYREFLSPIEFSPYVLLIPVPERVIGGFSSVWRPFEISVWTALLISIAVTMFLSLVNWLYNNNRNVMNTEQNNDAELDIHWLFLFGLLMSKAGFRAPTSFKMRLSGGAWCIAALILTNYYSSILTSLITISVPVPIANSVEEMANNDNIELVVVKGLGPANTITNGVNNSILKKLDMKIKSSQNSVCSDQMECFRQVVAKKTTTFLHNEANLFGILSKDYRQTHRCNANFSKENFAYSNVAAWSAWTISRHHPQREVYQRGTLRMIETGLVYHWKNMYLPKPYQCMVDPSSRQAMLADIQNPALVDLYSLYPAFVFLLIGSTLSSIALLVEWIRKIYF